MTVLGICLRPLAQGLTDSVCRQRVRFGNALAGDSFWASSPRVRSAKAAISDMIFMRVVYQTGWIDARSGWLCLEARKDRQEPEDPKGPEGRGEAEGEGREALLEQGADGDA